MRKVRIKTKPNYQSGGANSSIYPIYNPGDMDTNFGLNAKKTLTPVPQNQANLEAEKGETAYIPNVNGLAAHYNIGGKRHSEGGTPLNLPKDSFIFSDTKDLKIKDPSILKFFGIKGNKAITPAEIAKKYDINKHRETLADPDAQSDKKRVETAEKNIANANIKLGKLALVQESMKGYPDGIPEIALPYLAISGIDPQSILPLQEPQQQQQSLEKQVARYGVQVRNPYLKKGGPLHAGNQDWANAGNPMMQDGGSKKPIVPGAVSYIEKADELDKYISTEKRLREEAEKLAKEEEIAKLKIQRFLGRNEKLIENADKYLPKLYKEYEKFQQRRLEGYEPLLGNKPDDIYKNIKSLEESKKEAQKKLEDYQHRTTPEKVPTNVTADYKDYYKEPNVNVPEDSLVEMELTEEEARELGKEKQNY